MLYVEASFDVVAPSHLSLRAVIIFRDVNSHNAFVTKLHRVYVLNQMSYSTSTVPLLTLTHPSLLQG